MLIDFSIEDLEKFQKFQLSKIVETVVEKILSELQTAKFTPEITKFFIDLDKINTYIKEGGQKGEPFTQFDLEPDNITQIKKLVNALYHAHLALLDLEKMDIRSLKKGHKNALLIWQHTIVEIYQASYLLTHLDIDLKEMFGIEINAILPLITRFETLLNNNSANTKKITDTVKSYPISQKLGLITGTAIQQMQPQGGALDYKFLTSFSGKVPKYIKKVSGWINQCSSAIVEQEPGLNKEKIEELRQVALKLLNDLEHLKGNGLFVSVKFLKYIHIVRSIATLAMSTLEQVGDLSDSSQELIINNLSLLKYQWLPELFGLIDKIESHALLKPGTLSVPLMEQVKPFYALIVNYAGKAINFQIKGKELLSVKESRFSIEDSGFIEARLASTKQRLNAANKSIHQLKRAQKACHDFFKIIEDPAYRNFTISQVSSEQTREDEPSDLAKLIEHYKLFKSYMMQVDIDQNDAIIDALTNSLSGLEKIRNGSIIKANSLTYISSIIGQKTKVVNLIAKKLATHQFHIKLNTQIIDSILEKADFILFTYNGKTDLLIIDEAKIIDDKVQFKTDHGDQIVVNRAKLTSAQAYKIYEYYQNKHQSLKKAGEAYCEFRVLLEKHQAIKEVNGNSVYVIESLSEEVKLRCKYLYREFQPYFISGVGPGSLATAIQFDKYIVHSLNNTLSSTEEVFEPLAELFKPLDIHFQSYFSAIQLRWKKKELLYLQESNKRYGYELKEVKLKKELIVDARQHYVIQHTHYSTFVKQFRTALFETASFFNNAMQHHLIPKVKGTPFPELEDPLLVLAEPKPVIALKQIHNSLYYIEQVILQLEQLNNKSWETAYVYHLFGAYTHLVNLHKAIEGLSVDSHVKLISNDLLNKAQTLLATIQEHSEPYQTAPETLSTEPIEFGGLWYCLNAFYVSPKHIRALRNTNYLTGAELDQLHQQAKHSAVTIEYLIKNSNSYFKLFLQTPNMLRLYRDLVDKLNEFISTAHDTAINNLDKFYPKIFLPMLLEADHWEDTVGLKPGILAEPLQKVIEEYYKSLLTPLCLKSKKHIELAYDNTSLTQRRSLVSKQITSSTERLSVLAKKHKPIEHLNALLKEYDKLTESCASAWNILAPRPDFTIIKEQLSMAYKAAWPKLAKIQQYIEPSRQKPDPQFDAFLNSTTNEYDPKLNNIRGLIAASHCYYLGLKASEQMKQDTANEKLKYIKDLEVSHELNKQQFISHYTANVVAEQVKTFSKRHIGLRYVYFEYQRDLQNYLLGFKDELVNENKMAADINHAVETAVKAKIRVFERQHFTKYYHLEMIRAALFAFTAYFDSSNLEVKEERSLFESVATLDAKEELITQLRKTAENQQKPIDERIKQITAEIDISFKRIMLEHKEVEPFSYNFIVLLVSTLLETLHLYTSPRKKLYNDLKQAAVSEPKLENLTKYYGLFAVQADPIAAAPPPVIPTLAPIAVP